MISIIYGGNQEGICFDIYQSILSQLDNNNIRNINLQYENISLT
ncbi:flavodoxin, partial [Staphylococcus kloosii]